MAGNSLELGRSVTSKVISILMTFSDGEVHTLTEVARMSGMPISTVHRLIGELTACGALERTERAHYRIGVPLQTLCAHSGVRSPSLHERGSRVLEDLILVAQAPVRMGVLSHGAVSYLEKAAVDRTISYHTDRTAAPAHASAMGKVLLAFAPPTLVNEVVARGLASYTPRTLTAAAQLRETLGPVRMSRLAVSNGEWSPGHAAAAVPVFGKGSAVVAALEMTVRDLRADLRTAHAVLVVAARGLSRELAGGGDRYSPRAPRWSTAPPSPTAPAGRLAAVSHSG